MKNHLSSEILERYGHPQQLAGQAAASPEITGEAAMLHVANEDGASQTTEVHPKERGASQTTEVHPKESGASQTTEVHPNEGGAPQTAEDHPKEGGAPQAA